MRRVDTAGHRAQVVERVTVRNGSDVELVRHPVRPLLLPLVGDLPVEHAVAVRMEGAFPQPTIRAVADFLLKALPLVLRSRPHRHSRNHTTEYTEWIGAHLLAAIRTAA